MFKELERKESEEVKFIKKLVITLLFIGAIFLLYKIISIVVLVLISLFLNILIAPILNRFNKWKIGDALGVLLIYGAVILPVVMILYSIVPIFIKQISMLVSLIYNFLEEAISTYNAKGINGLGLPEFLESVLINIDLNQVLNSIKNNIGEIGVFVSNNLKKFLASGAGVIFSITNIFLNFALVLIFTFFIALERGKIRTFFYKVIPEKCSKYILKHEDKIVSTLSNWLKGQLILGVSIFLITYIGLLVIGLFGIDIKEKLTLAVLAGIMEFIPYIGPFIALLPALAMALGISWKAAAAVTALYLTIQQIENNVLVPYVMGKTLSLSPFSVLIAMIIGASLLGIIGIIASVPLVAIAQVLLSPYLERRKIK